MGYERTLIPVRYTIAKADVVDRLAKALNAGEPGVAADDLARLDAGTMSERVLYTLYETRELKKSIHGARLGEDEEFEKAAAELEDLIKSA
jgi:hypothetical protein